MTLPPDLLTPGLAHDCLCDSSELQNTPLPQSFIPVGLTSTRLKPPCAIKVPHTL